MTSSAEFHDCREVRYLIADGQNTTVTLEPQNWRHETQRVSAELLNLSQHGVKLVASESLPLRGKLRLKFAIEEIGLQFYVIADVCWSEQQSEGQWYVGCALSPGVPGSVFDLLASEGHLDRRGATRHPEILDLTMRRKLAKGHETVTLRDYSQGGFCVQVAESCKPGDHVCLCLEAPAVDFVIGEVKWQLKVDKTYLLGCRFSNTKDFERLQEAVGLDCRA